MQRINNKIQGVFSQCGLWAAMLLCCLLASNAWAVAKIEATKSRNYIRVMAVGEMPAPRLKTSRQGQRIRLAFDAAVQVNKQQLLKKLAPYVLGVSQSADQRIIELTTNHTYRTRNFVSSEGSGIDIIGLKEGGSVPPPPAEVKKLPKPETKPAADFYAKLAKVTPRAKPEVVTKKKVPASPVVEENEAVSVVEKKKETVPESPAPTKIESASEPVVETTQEPKTMATEVTKASQEASQNKEKVAEKSAENQEKKLPEQEETAPAPAKVLKVALNKEEGKLALTFPFAKRSAVAAFYREGRAFIVMNTDNALDISALNDEEFESAEFFSPAPGYTVLVLQTAYDHMKWTKAEESYEWQLSLTQTLQIPQNMLTVQAMTEPPLKPHLFIPVLETAQPITLQDPLIGDELVVIPLYAAETGLLPTRYYVEFNLLSSYQGLAIQPKALDLRIARTRNGIKITHRDGIFLSADLPPVDLPTAKEEVKPEDFIYFDSDRMQAPLGERSDTDFENRLWREAATTNRAQKNAARKRLAELYLAQGRGREVVTILSVLAQDAPVYFTAQKLHAYLGAGYFLDGQYSAAETAFDHATLDDEEEIKFWREAMDLVLREVGDFDYSEAYLPYLRHYPARLRQKLALIAANTNINRRQYNRALKVMDSLNKALMPQETQDYMQFLIGRILAATTQKSAARTIWTQLASQLDNRYVRPRAQFALTNLDLAQNQISVKKAIEQLDPLRIIWRGDQFEIALLTLLSNLYEEDGDYRNALRASREIVTYFPNYEKNLEITAHMGDIFKRLFNEGVADNLSPLQALALYYEFRNLTPIGRAGDEMIQNLADRLAAVELLDRAASLLQHQVEYRLSGEERSRIGARLALLKLLDRKPAEALEVLEVTGYGANPQSLQQQRSILTARALSELGEHERALKLLDGDDSREAGLLRLAIHWDQRQWKAVIDVAEKLMGQRVDPSLPLDGSEQGILLKLAIAYVFEGRRDQIQYLRDYFMPLLSDDTTRELFSFITDDMPVDYQNLSRLTAQIGRMESFLERYRGKIRESSLSGALE